MRRFNFLCVVVFVCVVGWCFRFAFDDSVHCLRFAVLAGHCDSAQMFCSVWCSRVAANCSEVVSFAYWRSCVAIANSERLLFRGFALSRGIADSKPSFSVAFRSREGLGESMFCLLTFLAIFSFLIYFLSFFRILNYSLAFYVFEIVQQASAFLQVLAARNIPGCGRNLTFSFACFECPMAKPSPNV